MCVRYPVDVSERQIDREAWATVVAQLVKDEADGNKSRFATLVGTTYKTVNRWLSSAVDVRESSVRSVARALGRNPFDLLVQVGYYAAEEVPPAPAQQVDPNDEAIRLIVESDLPPRIQMRMFQRLSQQRLAEQSRARQRELDEVTWWLEQAKEA